ncbi:hypothetical protein WH47_03737 [Habropoda laboriosa]|uniref:Uncharacterized protein n=1 Tax=Habropoda laboriosa TaxID=597456 RepID=A0A0L7QVV0_9HYME|nr:hypothetical protein WH47_03737 [Habropoda laboriosa]
MREKERDGEGCAVGFVRVPLREGLEEKFCGRWENQNARAIPPEETYVKSDRFDKGRLFSWRDFNGQRRRIDFYARRYFGDTVYVELIEPWKSTRMVYDCYVDVNACVFHPQSADSRGIHCYHLGTILKGGGKRTFSYEIFAGAEDVFPTPLGLLGRTDEPSNHIAIFNRQHLLKSEVLAGMGRLLYFTKNSTTLTPGHHMP